MGTLSISDDAHLRLLAEPDAPELHALIEANRVYLARWLPWARGQGIEDTRAFIREGQAQVADNNGFRAAIVTAGEVVGVISHHRVDWANRSTSIGYWLAEPRQGRGTMTAAVGALTEHALRAWCLNRVEVQTAVGNRRSRAIPERLGFREEGIRREAELVDGRYLDAAVYAMLARDWERQPRP